MKVTNLLSKISELIIDKIVVKVHVLCTINFYWGESTGGMSENN